MSSRNQLLPALLILAFVLVAIFAPLAMVGMSHHGMGSMGDCPFMPGEAVLCEMNIFAHLNSWQTLFATVAPELVTFGALLFAILLTFALFRNLFDPPDTSKQHSTSLYSRDSYAYFLVSFFLGSSISPRAP
ncbi:hypothetical protein EPO14_01285 [Patescibacteria group bacterium]|nr:MAG: hypothetical protein EPO14_01285 [Patescibacteria group bacterium]